MPHIQNLSIAAATAALVFLAWSLLGESLLSVALTFAIVFGAIVAAQRL